MTYEIYRYIFIIAAILCGVTLIVTAILFFLLNIPKVIGDLSGATAKKAIKEIREQNEKTGDKAYKVSQYNRDRGKLTDKISPSGNIVQQMQSHNGFGVDTSKISTQNLAGTENANETTVLQNETTVLQSETTVLQPETTVLSSETTVLSQPETEVLSTVGDETEILENNEVQTVVLNENFENNETAVLEETPVSGAVFEIEYDITFIHTNEIITAEAF